MATETATGAWVVASGELGTAGKGDLVGSLTVASPIGAFTGDVVGAFVGALTGDVVLAFTGDVEGLSVGAFAGDVVGAFTGNVVGACIGAFTGDFVGCGAVDALGLKTPFTLQPGELQSPNTAKVALAPDPST